MSIQKNTPNFLSHSGLSFTTIINDTMNKIKDPGTLGIYCYLASKPNRWVICIKELGNRFGKGRDYIRNKLKELKNLGLMKSISIKDEKGKIVRWETVLLNYMETHITENPSTLLKTHPSGKTTHLDKPTLVIKDNKEIKEESLKIKEKIKKTATRARDRRKSFPDKSHIQYCQERRIDIDQQLIKFKSWVKQNKIEVKDGHALFMKFLKKCSDHKESPSPCVSNISNPNPPDPIYSNEEIKVYENTENIDMENSRRMCREIRNSLFPRVRNYT